MKRLYFAFSLIAIALLVALGGGLGYLAATGRLTGEHVEQIAAILRGDAPVEAAPPPTSAPASQPGVSVLHSATAERIRYRREQEEILRRKLVRQREESMQAQSLVETTILDAIRRAEALDRQRKAFDARRSELAKQDGTEGFKKELKLIGGMTPKTAKEMLRTRSDADVVRVLVALSDRKAQQILGTCKSKEELAWADKILQQISNPTTEAPKSETSAEPRRMQTPN